jgi:NADH:ubiquinone oxidoreductase subunit 6 (subunit J)
MGAVIATNVLVLLIMPINKENAHNLLWVYWSQSILIGLLHFIKLLVYRFPRKAGAATNDVNTWSQYGVAFFFLFHYGFFHFVYVFFLGMEGVDWPLVGKAVSIFGGQMFLNAISHYKEESNGTQDIGEFMFKPYARIIPIHMAIILGGIGGSVTIFLVLVIFKTALETFIEYLDINKVSISGWIKEINDKYEANKGKD